MEIVENRLTDDCSSGSSKEVWDKLGEVNDEKIESKEQAHGGCNNEASQVALLVQHAPCDRPSNTLLLAHLRLASCLYEKYSLRVVGSHFPDYSFFYVS